MQKTTPTIVRKPKLSAAGVIAALGIACTGLPGCGGTTNTPQTEPADVAGAVPGEPGVRELPEGHRLVIYAVRGEITGLPVGMNDLMAKHEAIPEFITQEMLEDGTPKLGMNVMTMPFPAEETYDMSGLEVGDIAMLYFEVEYDAEGRFVRGHRLIRHEELPADTALDFTPLPPAAGDTAG